MTTAQSGSGKTLVHRSGSRSLSQVGVERARMQHSPTALFAGPREFWLWSVRARNLADQTSRVYAPLSSSWTTSPPSNRPWRRPTFAAKTSKAFRTAYAAGGKPATVSVAYRPLQRGSPGWSTRRARRRPDRQDGRSDHPGAAVPVRTERERRALLTRLRRPAAEAGAYSASSSFVAQRWTAAERVERGAAGPVARRAGARGLSPGGARCSRARSVSSATPSRPRGPRRFYSQTMPSPSASKYQSYSGLSPCR